MYTVMFYFHKFWVVSRNYPELLPANAPFILAAAILRCNAIADEHHHEQSLKNPGCM
jgi:hypothetical protein